MAKNEVNQTLASAGSTGYLHERETGALLHPNVREALIIIESVQCALSEIGMPFSAGQLRRANQTLLSHLTRGFPARGDNGAISSEGGRTE